MTPGHMVLTPGPMLTPGNGYPGIGVGGPGMHQWGPASMGMDYTGGATPYVTAPMGQPEEYFPPVTADAMHPIEEESKTGLGEGGYFPAVPDSVSASGSGGSSANLERSQSVAHSEADTATSTTVADSVDEQPLSAVGSGHGQDFEGRKASSDPAATIRARVAGLALDENSVPTMVNEIALASGLGMGTAKKMWANGSNSASLWMSQKGRFRGMGGGGTPVMEGVTSPMLEQPEQNTTHSDPTGTTQATLISSSSSPITLPKLAKRDFEFDVNNPGLFGLPSPGGGRRASWAEPGSRRPTTSQLEGMANSGDAGSR